MGSVDLKVGAVVLGTILTFTLVANAIPQVQSDVPELIAFGADVTADELVGAGQGLFEGAGGCVACHAEGTGARGPNLLTDYQGEGTIGQRCGDRVGGTDCKAYLYASLTEPEVFLVDDFPPIMPALNRTMNPQQVWAVVAFLQSMGGEVTVTGADIPSDAATGAGEVFAAGGGPAGCGWSGPGGDPESGVRPVSRACRRRCSAWTSSGRCWRPALRGPDSAVHPRPERVRRGGIPGADLRDASNLRRAVYCRSAGIGRRLSERPRVVRNLQ